MNWITRNFLKLLCAVGLHDWVGDSDMSYQDCERPWCKARRKL